MPGNPSNPSNPLISEKSRKHIANLKTRNSYLIEQDKLNDKLGIVGAKYGPVYQKALKKSEDRIAKLEQGHKYRAWDRFQDRRRTANTQSATKSLKATVELNEAIKSPEQFNREHVQRIQELHNKLQTPLAQPVALNNRQYR